MKFVKDANLPSDVIARTVMKGPAVKYVCTARVYRSCVALSNEHSQAHIHPYMNMHAYLNTQSTFATQSGQLIGPIPPELIHTRTYTHTHARTRTHTHSRTRTHAHPRTHTHTHTHTHAHTHTHTHTCEIGHNGGDENDIVCLRDLLFGTLRQL